MRRIPKIIHQTWKTKRLPTLFQKSQRSWKSKNPNWEYRFYSDKDCLDFVKKHFPQYLSLYQSLCSGVQRSDVFRYLVLYHYGGLYVDMDTTCLRPIDDWLNPLQEKNDTLDCIIGKDFLKDDPEGTGFGVEIEEYLQWCLISVPNHPLWIQVVEKIEDRLQEKPCHPNNEFDENYTLWLTGPQVVTAAIKEFLQEPQFMTLTFLNPGYLGNCSNHTIVDRKSCLQKAYLDHHYAGTWRNDNILEGFSNNNNFLYSVINKNHLFWMFVVIVVLLILNLML